MKDANGTFFNNQLHVGGGCTGNPKADSMVYAYSPDVDMWKVLPPCPLKWFGMTTWNKQLVLVGGREPVDGRARDKACMTNKLASWGSGRWEFPLPPMQVARVSPMAVGHGRYLAVTGGRRGYLGYSAEVLDSASMTWSQVASLPISALPHTSTLCGGRLYLMHLKSGKILQTDVGTFVRQKEETGNSLGAGDMSDSGESVSSDLLESEIPSIWQPVPKPPVPALRIASVGGYVSVFSHGSSGEGNMVVHSFFPETNSWYQVGKFPGASSNLACFTSPDGRLYAVGGDGINSQYSQKIFQASLTPSLD